MFKNMFNDAVSAAIVTSVSLLITSAFGKWLLAYIKEKLKNGHSSEKRQDYVNIKPELNIMKDEIMAKLDKFETKMDCFETKLNTFDKSLALLDQQIRYTNAEVSDLSNRQRETERIVDSCSTCRENRI